MNRKGEAAIATIIIIGMIWGAIATLSTQQIHKASHKAPVAVIGVK